MPASTDEVDFDKTALLVRLIESGRDLHSVFVGGKERTLMKATLADIGYVQPTDYRFHRQDGYDRLWDYIESFAELCPDDIEVRRMCAEQYTEHPVYFATRVPRYDISTTQKACAIYSTVSWEQPEKLPLEAHGLDSSCSIIFMLKE